jgi:SNF2 family DNA or RNA helicase
VVYAGSAADRAVIQKHDLFQPAQKVLGRGGREPRVRELKPDAVLTSYDTLLRDRTLFAAMRFDTVVVDEAHRLKSTGSSTRAAIEDVPTEWTLLLTGEGPALLV